MSYRVPPGVTGGSQGPVLVGNLHDLFPRRHPSLEGLLALVASAVLGGGPLTGVPGILLARLVLREVDDQPHLYTGTRPARAALAVAWVATIGWGAAWGAYLSRASDGLAYLVLGLGALGVAAVGVTHLVRSRRGNDGPSALPLLVPPVLAAVALIGSSVLGLQWRAHDRREQRAECRDLRERVIAATTAERFADARRGVEEASERCEGSFAIYVEGLTSSIDAHERAYRGRLEEARQAKLTERFRSERSAIGATLAEARASRAAGRWEAASEKLAAVSASLDGYRDARVTTSAEFQALRGEIATETKVVAPQLERMAKERAAAEERARKAEEAAKARAAAVAQARRAQLRLLCRDGTVSPTCLCSRTSRRGCCSHHGGVAGCED
ncbi:MAG: hypothetical protein KC731_12050 [Myxococcales bacterium]|nr:hypothetical protein [Myxococcales bacterium]